MSVGFGFSAGDFIAALKLVSTVHDALRKAGESSTQYRELLRELFSLETALLHVKRLEVDDSQYAEYIALQQAACQCQQTIDDFWKGAQKYQPYLAQYGSDQRSKHAWMKVKWALCKRKDVDNFQAALAGHTRAIELLLVVVQLYATRIRAHGVTNVSIQGAIPPSRIANMSRCRKPWPPGSERPRLNG